LYKYKPIAWYIKPFQLLYSLYAMALFAIILLIAFPLIVIASLFGKIKGANFLYDLCKVWTDLWHFLIGIRHKNIFEDPIDKNEHYVFKVVRKNHFRILGKIEMSRVPIFGYLYRQCVVMVDRGSVAGRAKSVKQLKSVLNKNISILLCPEGTFNETMEPLKEFYDGAFKIAIETQTPIKPVVLVDVTERLHYKNLFTWTPGKSRAIILKTIPVEGLNLKDVQTLKQTTYNAMEACLIKYRGASSNI
jgi:1-acyl-sn-glycerol-3-phosphate acyltransferase